MSDQEKGIKWWITNVFVPVLVGGGVIGAIINQVINTPDEDVELVSKGPLKIGEPYLCSKGGVLSGTHQNGSSDTWKVQPGVTVVVQEPHDRVGNVDYVRLLLDTVTITNTNGTVGLRKYSVKLSCYE